MTALKQFVASAMKALAAGVAAGAGAFQAGGTVQTSLAAGVAAAALTYVVKNR